MKGLIKKITILLLAVLTVKLCAELSFGKYKISIPESIAHNIVSFELGSKPKTVESTPPATSIQPSDTYLLPPNEFSPPVITQAPVDMPDDTLSSEESIVPNIIPDVPVPEANLPDNYEPQIENLTSTDIDVAALMSEASNIVLGSTDAPQILILHSHGSEAFSETEGFRTLDKTMSIIRVGDALTTELQNRGFNVIHDRTIYDYPSYSSSYSRAGDAVEEWLVQHPSIQIVFDIHRDAIEKPDGSQYITKFTPPGGFADTAQIMSVVTNGEKGLSHPNWQENMKFALGMQSASDALYPGLLRPLCISGQRYNEQLAPGYVLLEVGSTGNSIEEAVAAIRLFATPIEQTLNNVSNQSSEIELY